MGKKGVNLGEKNGNYKYPTYYINCANCGKEIRVPGSIKNKKFCDIKCKARWQSKNATRETNYFHTHAGELRRTFEEKYGVVNPMQVESFKKRAMETSRLNNNKRSYYSKISIKLFESIIKKTNIIDVYYKDNEFFIRDGDRILFYDFKHKNKIIEYNGDYFHCNPKLYEKDYFHVRKQMTSEDIWSSDKDKNDIARSKGYDILVVWEKDHKDDPEHTINTCIKFLREEK